MTNISLNIIELKGGNGQLVIITHKDDVPIIYHCDDTLTKDKSFQFELHPLTIVVMEGFKFQLNNNGVLKVSYKGDLSYNKPGMEWFDKNESIVKDSLSNHNLADFHSKYIDLYDKSSTNTRTTVFSVIGILLLYYLTW